MIDLRRLGVAAAVAALLISQQNGQPSSARSKEPVNHDADERFIRSQADDYAKAFATGDAAAIANMWTADGTYTDSTGHEYHGRDEILKLFSTFFKDSGGRPLKISIDSIKFPAPNIAIEEGTASVLKDSIPVSSSRYMVVHVKEKDQWPMMAVEETDVPRKASGSISSLSWMEGRWSATTGSDKVRFFIKSDPQHHFLLIGSGDFKKVPIIWCGEIVAWHPNLMRLVSWHFDSKGGFGNGVISMDGNSVVEDARGTECDGRHVAARYIIRKLSDAQISWQSTNRSVDGVSLPDMQEVVLTREESHNAVK